MEISQSGWVITGLIVGFVLWLAVNKKLQNYWSLLVGGGVTSAAAGGAPSYLIPPVPAIGFPGVTGSLAPLNQFLQGLGGNVTTPPAPSGYSPLSSFLHGFQTTTPQGGGPQ